MMSFDERWQLVDRDALERWLAAERKVVSVSSLGFDKPPTLTIEEEKP
jgi:hypothetical protein